MSNNNDRTSSYKALTEQKQQALLTLGYDLGDYGPEKNGVDGAHGKLTQNALEDFEKKHGQKATLANLKKAAVKHAAPNHPAPKPAAAKHTTTVLEDKINEALTTVSKFIINPLSAFESTHAAKPESRFLKAGPEVSQDISVNLALLGFDVGARTNNASSFSAMGFSAAPSPKTLEAMKMYRTVTGKEPTPENVAASVRDAQITATEFSKKLGNPVPVDCVFAIKSACAKTGADPALAFAMSYSESGFKNNASPGGDQSALGLFQFIDQTWNDMIGLYGGKYGLNAGNADRTNPMHSALMGAECIKIYQQTFKSALPGREVNSTDIYMCHFFGDQKGVKFVKDCTNNPDGYPDTKGEHRAAAKANPTIFYKEVKNIGKKGHPNYVGVAGTERTNQEIYDLMQKKMASQKIFKQEKPKDPAKKKAPPVHHAKRHQPHI